MSNTKDQVRDEIFRIMAATFDVPREELDESASMDTIANWDSIRHMNLVVSLEQDFSIEFDDTEIVELLNFKLIENIVRAKLA